MHFRLSAVLRFFLALLFLTGCTARRAEAPKQAIVERIVEVTREVPRDVTREVTREVAWEVTREVTREITREVIREVTRVVIVTPTPLPPTPSPTAPPLQPQDARASAYVCGNASPDLPDGEPGKLAIVASRMSSVLGLIELVIRNNTAEPVLRISVSAVAYTADGKLFATGGDQLGFQPKYVAPGEIAMGYVYFCSDVLPEDARVEYEWTAKKAASGKDTGDLEVEECSRVAQRIVGWLENAGSKTVSGPIGVTVYCFDEESNLLGYRSDYTDKDTVNPGESAPFQAPLYSNDVCPVYLVVGSGYAW